MRLTFTITLPIIIYINNILIVTIAYNIELNIYAKGYLGI